MKKTLLLIVYFIFFQNILFAEPNFPELTGRVVDNAQILSSTQEEKLSLLLKKHEEESSNQIVILSLESLENHDIADYAYQLGRHWGIGQKGKNNGVLLIVSMADKKIRIEVGYGLEGSLTDKISHDIIEYVIKTNFKQGKFYDGIEKASQAIIEAIKGEFKASNYNVLEKDSENWFFVYFIVIFLSMIFSKVVRKYKNNTLSKIFYSSMLAGFAGAFAIGLFQNLIISLGVFFTAAILVFIFTRKISFSNQTSNIDSSYSKKNSRDNFGGGYKGKSGGGFSGRGGSFGGGGASGGW